MNAHRGSFLALMASMLMVGCTQESVGNTAAPSSEESVDYVLLRDDDSDPDQVRGEPGSYALTARGDAVPRLAVVDVPEGYANFGFFALWPEGSTEPDPPPFRSLQYWTVHGVFAKPCERKDEAAPVIGPSVEDLAEALGEQELTSSSQPQSITLDEYDGLYLELTVPSDITFEDCVLGYYMFWEGRPGDAQHTADSPGLVERLWILDVEGERVVLAAATLPGVSDELVEELGEMVESVRFVDPQ